MQMLSRAHLRMRLFWMNYFLAFGCVFGVFLVVFNVWYWRDFTRTERQHRVDETTEFKQGLLPWSAIAACSVTPDCTAHCALSEREGLPQANGRSLD